MTPSGESDLHSVELSKKSAFATSSCLPFIRNAQNPDGGWGFQPALQSRVEPTCWAILALRNPANTAAFDESVTRGLQFLRNAQLADGSWAASAELRTGCWVTSVACWVLSGDAEARGAVTAGVKWLCNDWPRDSSLWRRLRARFSSQNRISAQNNSYRGWGWTPGTSSWVEPTSFGLILLGRIPAASWPKGAQRRHELARKMLYDRMCPGGGWNCGNPMVYGVAGEALIIPTVWALLALRDEPNRPEFVMSLNWLEKNVENARGTGSLALARICMEVNGRRWPAAGAAVTDFCARNESMQNVPVAAWTCLASRDRHEWLTAGSRELC